MTSQTRPIKTQNSKQATKIFHLPRKNFSSKNLTDEKLYELCQQYGEQALLWRRKFAGLLPEVNHRRLYEKKGFVSIFEFAAKLCGMSKDQVCVVLNLERRFEDKHILKEILIEGKVGVNKLARIVSVATLENQEFLANQVQLLTNRAIETLVRDIKFVGKNVPVQVSEEVTPENQNGLFELQSKHESLHVQTINLSPEVVAKLSELQNKGIDINKMILGFLKKREKEIEQQKTEIAEEQRRKSIASKDANASSRYVPTKIKKIIYHEHGTKCSIPNCRRTAQTIHHTNRFAITPIHDPHFLAPLCREHHLIAHSVDQKFHEKWRG